MHAVTVVAVVDATAARAVARARVDAKAHAVDAVARAAAWKAEGKVVAKAARVVNAGQKIDPRDARTTELKAVLKAVANVAKAVLRAVANVAKAVVAATTAAKPLLWTVQPACP